MRSLGVRWRSLRAFRTTGSRGIELRKHGADLIGLCPFRAIARVQKYLDEARPRLVNEPDDGWLFLAYTGQPFSPDLLTRWVADYVDAANIGKSGSCHMFRHSVATLMLERGADIRNVQEMLGHASIETTQLYTKVSIRQLKAIHTATHPSAKLERAPITAAADHDDES